MPLRMQRLPANRQGFDAIALHLKAKSDLGGDDDLAFGADYNGGLDNVLGPVAAGCGDIAGKREVRQRKGR